MEHIAGLVLAAFVMVAVVNCNVSLDRADQAKTKERQEYCGPICAPHPPLYKNEDGSCVCDSGKTVVKPPVIMVPSK